MHSTILATFALFAVSGAFAQTTTARAADAIAALRWQRRIVAVFSTDAADQKLAKQRAILAADAAGVAERKLAIVEVIGDVATVDGAARTDVDVVALRRQCAVGPEQFRVVLIGLDGGVKLRRDEAITTQLLFETVDRMPMRRDEMNAR